MVLQERCIVVAAWSHGITVLAGLQQAPTPTIILSLRGAESRGEGSRDPSRQTPWELRAPDSQGITFPLPTALGDRRPIPRRG